MRQNGFTIIELAISSAVFTLLFGSVAAVMVGDSSTQRTVAAHVGPEVKAHHALERMVRELQMASIRGEDRNADGVLDPAEDFNSNYAFDADWSLNDGAKDQTNLTFNRRLGVKDTAEELSAGTIFSQGITYSVVNNRLVRVARRVDPDTGATISRANVLAEGVSGLRFSRSGFLVTISLDVALPKGVYKDTRRTITERVLLRN